MSARTLLASRFAPLRHPAFVAALFVLIANDHFFKGAGLLPSILTGKASDFAGMVVAPVLVACAVGPRHVRARAAAFVLVPVAFAATKIFPAAAELLCATMTSLGLPYRIVADPTDLVGLVVLPFAWRLLDAGTPAAAPVVIARPASRWLERALVGASAAACVASGAPRPPAVFDTPAYIVNTRRAAVDVRVRGLAVPTRCDALEGLDVARVFGPDAFDLGATFHLEPDEVLSLTDLVADDTSDPPRNDEDPPPTCQVFALALGNARETLVFWNTDAPVARVEGQIDEEDDLWDDPTHRAARIEITSGGFSMEHEHAPMQRDVAPDACGLSDIAPFEQTLPAGHALVIDAVTTRPEGCLEVTHHPLRTGPGGAAPEIGFVCVPPDAFPFVAGDVIEVAVGTITAIASKKARVTIHGGVPLVGLPRGDVLSAVAAPSCSGNRDDCGGYQIEAAVARCASPAECGTPSGTHAPGSTFVDGTTSVFIGRARAVITRPDSCDASVLPLGYSFDAVVVERSAP